MRKHVDPKHRGTAKISVREAEWNGPSAFSDSVELFGFSVRCSLVRHGG